MKATNLHKILTTLTIAIVMIAVLGWGSSGFATQYVITPDQGLQQLTALSDNSLLLPGTTVLLKAGTYTGTAHLSWVNGTQDLPIVISGESGTIIESWKDKSTQQYMNGSSLLIENSSYIQFNNLDISGAERGFTLGSCNNVTVANNFIHDISNYGIMSYRSSGVTIDTNDIERSFYEHGIYVSDFASNIHIVNNTIRDTFINGIHINGAVVAPLVENNLLERTGRYPTGGGGGAGITFIGGVTSPVARGNTFRNIYGQGITIDAPDGTIASNTFEDYTWSGILGLAGAVGLTLDSNKFQDSGTYPLQFGPNMLSTLKATNDTYLIQCGLVYQNNDTGQLYSLEQWKAMGFDVASASASPHAKASVFAISQMLLSDN